MGCDIHLYVEKRDASGAWQCMDKVVREDQEDGSVYISTSYAERLYTGRNYNLFAMLADVRNGRGFAGCKTGEGFVPLAPPRGIPEDVSPEGRELLERYGEDGHSHSHHTLRQLLDYDWTQTTSLQGWVDAVTYAKWSRWGKDHGEAPADYCGGVSGGAVEHVSEERMRELLAPVLDTYGPEREEFAKKFPHIYTLATWTQQYSDCAGEFFTKTIPALLKLAGGTAGLDDVRIVFFFDN